MKANLTAWQHRWPPKPDEKFGAYRMVSATAPYLALIKAWIDTSPAWKGFSESELTSAAWVIFDIDELAYKVNFEQRGGEAWKPRADHFRIFHGKTKKEERAFIREAVRHGCIGHFWKARNAVYQRNFSNAINYTYLAGRMVDGEANVIGEKFLKSVNEKLRSQSRTATRDARYRERAHQLRTDAKRERSDTAIAQMIRNEALKHGEKPPSVVRIRHIIAN